MQGSDTVITDTKDGMQDCIENLEDLRKEEPSLPFESETNLPATKNSKKVTKKLKVIQLKFSSTTSIK